MFDLATAKEYLGITNATLDTQLQTAMNMSLSMAERYCNCKFGKQVETEVAIPVHGMTIQLHRLPINSITSITQKDGGSVTDYVIDDDAGIVRFSSFVSDRKVTVVYDGGRDPIDNVVVAALLSILGQVWPSFKPSAGAGGSSAMAGQVKSVSSDGARIEYFGDTSGSGSSQGFAGGMITPFAQAILDIYRIEEC